jgi:hypothetical protein
MVRERLVLGYCVAGLAAGSGRADECRSLAFWGGKYWRWAIVLHEVRTAVAQGVVRRERVAAVVLWKVGVRRM